ncbi:MAG: PKD domain-containing protein [Actinomycetota bacterium]
MCSLRRAGIVVVLALAAAAPAQAAGQWLSPHDVTPTAGPVSTPSVATDSLGSVFAVWASDGAILSASRPAAAGTWESPQTLVAAGGTGPRIAVTGAGTAIAVWLRAGLVEAAVRPPGAAWGPAQTISSPLDTAQSPQIAVDRAGDAFAAWGRARAGELSIKASFRPVETGMWGSPEPVTTPPASDYEPALAVGASGGAIVVSTLPDGYLVSSFRSAEAQAWGSPQTIATGGGITANGFASVGLDDAGNAVVVFDHREGLNSGVVASRRLVSAGSWEPWIPIGQGSNQSTDIALDRLGNAIAIWQGGGSQSIIQAAALPFGGSWGAAETVSQGITHRWPAIALDATGKAFAVWQRTTQPPPPPPYPNRLTGVEYAARAAIRPAGGPWQPSQDISLPGIVATDIGVAADPAGNGIAAWRRPGDFLQVAAYDGAGPVLDDLSIPDHAEPGVPVVFSVDPFDVWSAVAGEATWAFGDGGTATGDLVSHEYSPGSYVVSVRAADSLGNETTASGSILVGQPPPPPPVEPPPLPPPPATRRCRVPRVVGRKLPVARTLIRRAHCVTGRIRRARSRRARGRVLAQSPRAGRRVRAGTRVNLVVSRGR